MLEIKTLLKIKRITVVNPAIPVEGFRITGVNVCLRIFP
jgi:hypothetical protein